MEVGIRAKSEVFNYLSKLVESEEANQMIEEMLREHGKKPVVKKVVYSNMADRFDYSKFTCVMDDGSEEVFHYPVSNPIPKEYVLMGRTWEWVIGFMNGMWREVIGEHQEIEYIKRS